MNKIIIIIALIIIGAGFTSCEEDVKPCIEERETSAIIGTFPDSLQVNESYHLQIKYLLDNSCGKFDRYDITIKENIFEVSLIAKYEGCNCDIEFSEHQMDYEIDIDYPGIYEYRFWQSDEDWDIRTLKIYE